MKNKKVSGADLLLLTGNEMLILDLLQKNVSATPASLSKLCRIPRPTIYITLDRLQERGLVQSKTLGKRKFWEMGQREIVQEKIERLKNTFGGNNTDYQKMNLSSDTDLTIYRGEKTISNLFTKLVEKHGGNRLMGIQGDFAGDAWKDTFKLKNINALNAKIKSKGLITEIITSKDWFKRQIETFGPTWAKHFGGRAAQVHFIDSKYLDYESQIFIFEDQLFLVSMREELFIEVKNEMISKLIISLLKFVEDNSPSVDINKLLRDMTNKKYS